MTLRTALHCAGVLAFLLSGAPSVGATEAEPRGVYKRIKAPKPGDRPRVTVQITAEEHATRPSAPSTGAEISVPDVVARTEVAQPVQPETQAKRDPKGSYKAFWDRISPEIGQGGAGRLDAAISALAATSVRSPRLQTLQNIAQQQGKEILRSTVGTNVSPALVLAVISVESSGRPEAVSRAGAEGLMQLMPATATRFGVTDSFDPAQNIDGGVAYLDWLMGRFGGDPVLALAGYNAGENAVIGASGVPDYAETRAYVPKVIAAWAVAKGLCLTPPDLASDGCVFASMAAR